MTVLVSAPVQGYVEWDYAHPDPGRPAHRVLHCSVADITVSVARRATAPAELRASGTAAYEWGRPGAPGGPFSTPRLDV